MTGARYCNRGDTGLRNRLRKGDPMQAFDRLPRELRQWMAGAHLPWSPRSCDRIWRKAASRGLTVSQRLTLLNQVEAATLNKAPH